MKLYRKSSRRKILAVFCLLLFFAGCIWYARTSGGLVADAYVYAASPVRIAGGFAANIGYGVKDFFTSRQKREKTLTELREENRKLQESVARIAELEVENNTLRAAFDFQLSTFNSAPIMAQVVGKGSHIFGQEIVLNKGSDAGIHQGDAVLLGERALLGRIVSVTLHHSRVMLLGNRDSRAMVKILDPSEVGSEQSAVTSAEGLVRGEGFGNVILDMVPSNALLKEGDVIVTSGFDSLFPPSIVIGRVSRVISGPSDFFQKAQITPAADMGVVDRVMVLRSSL